MPYFFAKRSVICAASLDVCLFSSPGEAVSCPGFQWDTSTSSLREAWGHGPDAEIRRWITILKSKNPETGTQIGSGTCPGCILLFFPNTGEIEEVCSLAFHSGNISSACPLSREKDRLQSVYARMCVYVAARQPTPLGPVFLRLNIIMSRETTRVHATKTILDPADKPQASFHRPCSPLERETRMESGLPARLGIHLDMPGGRSFRATKQQEL